MPIDQKLHQNRDQEHFDGFDFEQRLHLDYGLLQYQGGLADGQGGRDGFGFGGLEPHPGGLVGHPQLAGSENCYWPFAILPWDQTVDGLPVLPLCVVVVGVVVAVVVDVDDAVVVALVIVAGVLQDD